MVLGYVLTIVGGIVFGGIVNWLADQLPFLGGLDDDEEQETAGHAATAKPQGLTVPRCLKCGARRHILSFLGLTAWCLGKRRCENCESRLPFRHLAVEVVLAAAYCLLWMREGMIPLFWILSFYLTLFVLIAVIDIEHRLVLNIVVFPAFVIVLIEVMLSGRIGMNVALMGYAVGQIVVLGFFLLGGVYLWIVNTARQQPVTEVAFGFGDVTLATLCGLIVGFPDVFQMLVLMILFGGLIAFLYILYRVIIARDYHPHIPIAYGPAILLSAAVMLLWGGL
ncbi:MAG: prepilin peptidase [Anaerolineae bacterium]|nr:prepilin peptidase [Anaerolineae bacterium]